MSKGHDAIIVKEQHRGITEIIPLNKSIIKLQTGVQSATHTFGKTSSKSRIG